MSIIPLPQYLDTQFQQPHGCGERPRKPPQQQLPPPGCHQIQTSCPTLSKTRASRAIRLQGKLPQGNRHLRGKLHVFLPRMFGSEASALCRGLRTAGDAPPNDIELASMRPRRYAEDYLLARQKETLMLTASMRPRRYAEDYGPTTSSCAAPGPSFNEASALCRGLLPQNSDGAIPQSDFNEASALCRGLHVGNLLACCHLVSFNEASALCRGLHKLLTDPEVWRKALQ